MQSSGEQIIFVEVIKIKQKCMRPKSLLNNNFTQNKHWRHSANLLIVVIFSIKLDLDDLYILSLVQMIVLKQNKMSFSNNNFVSKFPKLMSIHFVCFSKNNLF